MRLSSGLACLSSATNTKLRTESLDQQTISPNSRFQTSKSYPPSNIHHLSMAYFTIPFFVLILLLISASSLPTAASRRLDSGLDRGKKVGGWTEIPNAESNKEIRDLGRYSVNEYNHDLRGIAESPLAFSSVVSAGRQVVSGIKYWIRVATVDTLTGDPRFFDAIIVVRPWLSHSARDLVSFSPSAA